MGYSILKNIFGPIIKLFWLGKVTNMESIPKEGPFIIAANHKSYLDFLLLFSIIPIRISFLAGEVFFKKTLSRFIMNVTGQIRVDRNSQDKSSVYGSVDNLFKSKGVLGVFPEGTRSRDGKIGKVYNGAVKFSKNYGVPIIPVGIIGTYYAWPPHRKFPRIRKCRINFGEKFFVSTEDFDKETNKLMKKIAYLANEEYNN